MSEPIKTVEGWTHPTPDDLAFMDYLDGLWSSEYEGFGVLLYKGDPVQFRLGRDEWLQEWRSDDG